MAANRTQIGIAVGAGALIVLVFLGYIWWLSNQGPVLAASLAIGERIGASSAAFVDAFLVGFEVECKIAEAIIPSHYQRGFHSTGTIGTFGAAASAARLMKLSPMQTAHTLGIAASMSSGIRVNFGSMTKPLHAGRAAENGVTAAELASRGFTGHSHCLTTSWRRDSSRWPGCKTNCN